MMYFKNKSLNHFSTKKPENLMIYQIFDWFTNKMSTACKISYFSANIRCGKAFFWENSCNNAKKKLLLQHFCKNKITKTLFS